MNQTGDFAISELLIFEEVFLWKVLLIYLVIKGSSIYSLGWKFVAIQLLIMQSFLHPMNETDLFWVMSWVSILAWPTHPKFAPSKLFKVWKKNPDIIWVFTFAALLVLLFYINELTLIHYPFPQVETIITLIFLPSILMGLHREFRKWGSPNCIISIISPLRSLKILLPDKWSFSLSISIYHCSLILISYLLSSLKFSFFLSTIFLFLSYFLINGILKYQSERLNLQRVKSALHTRRKFNQLS